MSATTTAQSPVLSQRAFWILFALIGLVGAALRISDSAAFRATGFDESLYRRYVYMMDGGKHIATVQQKDQTVVGYQTEIEGSGAGALRDMSAFFLDSQKPENSQCELPPTRFLYIYTSWLWKRAQFGDMPKLTNDDFGRKIGPNDPRSMDPDHRDPALASLHRVACLFTILWMLAGGLFAWRMAGPGSGLGVLALMAFSPVQMHFSQHALIDGFFAFWATMCVWTTWECLQNPTSRAWLLAHGACLALMVLTKLENAFFVCCGLGLAVLLNRWLRFGTASPRFIATGIGAPLLGIALLVMMSGGPSVFADIYKTLVLKAQDLDYAKLTGDGPWYRYLLDLLTVSPLVLLLAIGALFRFVPVRKDLTFLTLFVAGSYVVMCNVKYGMNLRYTSIWEFPIRFAAVLAVVPLFTWLQARQWMGVALAVVGLCSYDFRQYQIFAMNHKLPLYELVSNQLLMLVKVLKDPRDL